MNPLFILIRNVSFFRMVTTYTTIPLWLTDMYVYATIKIVIRALIAITYLLISATVRTVVYSVSTSWRVTK